MGRDDHEHATRACWEGQGVVTDQEELRAAAMKLEVPYFPPRRKYARRTEENKRRIVAEAEALIAQKKPLSALIHREGIDYSQLRRLRREFAGQGPTTVVRKKTKGGDKRRDDRELAALRAVVETERRRADRADRSLRMIRELLQIAGLP